MFATASSVSDMVAIFDGFQSLSGVLDVCNMAERECQVMKYESFNPFQGF